MPIGEDWLRMHLNILLKPTQMAPDFEADALVNSQKESLRLSQFRDQWVLLYFYASDFTFVWPTELAAVAAKQNILDGLGVQVLALSTDSVYSHKVFSQVSPSARTIHYPLLSDRTQQISRMYGVLREDMGFTFRATFILAPGGQIKYVSLYPPEVARNINEILRIIQALQYESATGYGVQAGWLPGMQGIQRDFSMVGRI